MPRGRIEVTQEIIDAGIRGNSGHCMVADAVEASIVGAKRAYVDLATIRYTDHQGIRRTYFTPQYVAHLLIAFDDGAVIEPFDFALRELVHTWAPPTAAEKAAQAAGRARVSAKKELAQAPRPEPRSRAKARGRASNDRPLVVGGPELPNTMLAGGYGARRYHGVRVARGFDAQVKP